MPKNVVIVESPAKARTIAQYLGKDFDVVSSFGHVRDLPKKGLGVDIAKDFEPEYEVSPDKKKVVADLKRAAKGATVWLASDEDREGEAIAWHVTTLLGLDPARTNRIVFHEITKPAITEAVAKPRVIDMKLVDAQQARRILDRLVGYELSPVLWKKVRTGLSAGRVQSVAVRLIVEREREIKAYEASSSFRIKATFSADRDKLEAELDRKLNDETSSRELLEALIAANFKIENIEQKPGSRSPSAPFITSTLQQEASRRLGFSVRQTMMLAQRLYESGHITYMRTDGTNLSGLAIAAAKEYITKNFGAKYSHVRQYKTRSKSAQEAHEAIRPTNINSLSAGADERQKKLYQLIWQRTVASQMAAASVEKTRMTIGISERTEKFQATGEVVIFDGFLKVYGGGKEDVILPKLQVGQALDLVSASATEGFDRLPPRYSEASLVRKLEELGIGRPSTYAPTISTIQDRGYIEKRDVEGDEKQVTVLTLKSGKLEAAKETVWYGADRNKLMPTHLAEVVTDFLLAHFGSIVDYDFTALAEEEFDDIASGKKKWRQTLKDFYAKFHPLVEKSEKVDRAEAAQARELGKDPKTGKPIIVRYARFGPVLQLGSTDEETKPTFAPMPPGSSLADITLEQALPMFALPRQVGKTADGQPITANYGRFGPYIQVDGKFVSIKDHDPLTISEEQAQKIFAEHQKAAAERTIADFGKIKILKGRFGPYVTNGQKNAKIPKDFEPSSIGEAQAKDLLDKAPARAKRARRK